MNSCRRGVTSGTIFPIRQADRFGAVKKIIVDGISGNKSSASRVAQSMTTTMLNQQVLTPPKITEEGETDGHVEGLAPLVEQKGIGPWGPSGEHTSKEDGDNGICL